MVTHAAISFLKRHNKNTKVMSKCIYLLIISAIGLLCKSCAVSAKHTLSLENKAAHFDSVTTFDTNRNYFIICTDPRYRNLY